MKKIREKKAVISVVGMGYIGLPTALFYAKKGLRVKGIDTNEELIGDLGEGRIRMREEGLEELAEQYLPLIEISAKYDKTIDSDICVLCLPSPIDQNKEAVTDYLESAVTNLASRHEEHIMVLVESTVPIGTTNRLADMFGELSGLNGDENYWFAHCPERVLPGQVVNEMEKNHRLAGGVTPDATKLATAFLSSVFHPDLVHPTTARVAEAAKLAENAYRDVNIAYVNELAKICTEREIDVHEVIDLANLHPRVSMLRPGLGVGGYCLPKDGWILVHGVNAHERVAELIPSARHVNDSMPQHVFRQIQTQALVHPLQKQHVGLIGLSFKPNISDTRNSPSVELLRLFSSVGIKTTVYDPFVDKDFGVHKSNSLDELLEMSEIVVVCVGHDRVLAELGNKDLSDKVLVDPWNLLHGLRGGAKRYVGLTL
jgi:UDP-N-acetyl-D-mannosaminuronic acid dehydrogenase